MYVKFLYPVLGEEEESLKLGSYPFVQITYRFLRIGPNGGTLAYLNDEEEWELTELVGEHEGKKFRDVVIFND